MASTSASSVQKSFKYDVFLSFRGEDVRKTFVDHLYHALVNKGITTYKDDERIEKGERISDQLIRSIEDSRFHIIVFSKNYASSSWCLDELVEIMECQRSTEQTAYPVFYDVEPTEVRNQSGAVGEAFAKLHAQEEGARRWREALKEAAGLAGWDLKNSTVDGHEAKFIQGIVKYISLKPDFFNSSVDGKLVGMKTRVKDVVSSLEIDSNDVRMIGLKGMGGGGKTTLARAVFDHISIQYEGKSFIENVREVSEGSSLKDLQTQVLQTVLNDQSIVVRSVSEGKIKMKKMMCSRKVLVVLDDVNDIDQLEALAGELTWFKPGSRIIITTRDEQVLVAHSVNFIHNVSLLSNEEAICLFSRYAFKRETPNQGYGELSRKVIHYAAGLPLTIKVLGSHLCGRNKHEWEDAIERLKSIPLEKTLKRLELSYNGLENDEKEIFLDVVCMLKGYLKNEAIRILESCGYNARIGLRVLEQKSLITISYNYLGMHDHIEEMGRNIVRRLHPNEPSKHTRLWIKEEIEDILVNETGTEATRNIRLIDTDLHTTVIMKGLIKMRGLRFLYVDYESRASEADEVSQYLPDALQYLYWNQYPFCCLPKTFRANKLVNFEMPSSNISQLWEVGERKGLNKLKFVDLRFSKLRTFDLGMTPNLETLNLMGCEDFVELHVPSECLNLKVLDLSHSKVSKLNLGMTPNLETLNLMGCKDFVELHVPSECLNLKFLDLGYSKVSNLILGMTPDLERLKLEGCNDFVELYMPIECRKLKELNLRGSKLSNLNLKMTPHIEMLVLEGCKDFVELHMPVECPKLEQLNLSGTKVSNLNLGLTPNLRKLDLMKCFYLQEIYGPVGCLKRLAYLDLVGCRKFKYFQVLKQHELADLLSQDTLKLTIVDICPPHPSNNPPKFWFKCEYDECGSSRSNLEATSASICDLRHLRELTLEGSIPKVPIDVCRLESLEKLTLRMEEIQHLPDSIYMLKHLKHLKLKYCMLLEQLPESICRLECLEVLHIRFCISIRNVPNSICNMKCLKGLCLSDCHQVEELPEELGRLECLKELDIKGTGVSRLPHSINRLKGLRIIGSREQLQSYGFTSLTEIISRFGTSYYVEL